MAELAAWLVAQGFAAGLVVLEALGGPNERLRATTAQGFDLTGIAAPVAVALTITEGRGLPRASGLEDGLFAHDGQITKRPVRALTLSALAPRAGERLWDIGAGSGSIAVEWCLAGGIRARWRRSAGRPGGEHPRECGAARHGPSPDGGRGPARRMGWKGRRCPDAVFVGGGGDGALIARLWGLVPEGTRIVMNGVTLETEACWRPNRRRAAAAFCASIWRRLNPWAGCGDGRRRARWCSGVSRDDRRRPRLSPLGQP